MPRSEGFKVPGARPTFFRNGGGGVPCRRVSYFLVKLAGSDERLSTQQPRGSRAVPSFIVFFPRKYLSLSPPSPPLIPVAYAIAQIILRIALFRSAEKCRNFRNRRSVTLLSEKKTASVQHRAQRVCIRVNPFEISKVAIKFTYIDLSRIYEYINQFEVF